MAAPSPQKCMNCRERAVSPARLDSYVTELEHDGRKYAISLADFPVLKCRHCGEIYLDEAGDERLSDALRAAAGLLSPAEIRKDRERFGLTQKQLAGLFRISEFTLSRWEAGAQIQQRSMDAFLRIFFHSGEARRLLGALERRTLELRTGGSVGIVGRAFQPQYFPNEQLRRVMSQPTAAHPFLLPP
jgi:putative zinc finger/helix-turn-helix YgiT family protein